jgi:hypothetical protein
MAKSDPEGASSAIWCISEINSFLRHGRVVEITMAAPRQINRIGVSESHLIESCLKDRRCEGF